DRTRREGADVAIKLEVDAVIGAWLDLDIGPPGLDSERRLGCQRQNAQPPVLEAPGLVLPAARQAEGDQAGAGQGRQRPGARPPGGRALGAGATIGASVHHRSPFAVPYGRWASQVATPPAGLAIIGELQGPWPVLGLDR